MADIFPLRPSEHDTVQELLPWYVNGTLDAEEVARVEAHLGGCAECREELAFDRRLAQGVAALPLTVDDSWQTMVRRLDEKRPTNVVEGPFGLLRRRVPMGWAVGGSLAASVALAVLFVGLQPDQPAEQTYRALGSAAAASEGQVVVLFKPDTTEQQMRVILSAQGARLVDGPTAAGAYVLRFDRGNADDAIAQLRESSQIVLAEPISADGRR